MRGSVKRLHKVFLFPMLWGLLGLGCLQAAEPKEEVIQVEEIVQIERPTAAGGIFDVEVSMDNYLFARAAAAVFGGSWGRQAQTPEELEERTWEDLILSYEAFRRGIEVPQEKVDEEIGKLLKAEKRTARPSRSGSRSAWANPRSSLRTS